MSVLELLAIIELAVITAYSFARLLDADWRRVLVWGGGRERDSCSNLTSGVRTGYVSQTTPAHFRYVRRGYRYELHCPMHYCVNGLAKEGLVVDMTREGWRVRVQEELVPGMALSLDVMLPDAASSVVIARAAVLWVEGRECGMKLERMEPEPAARLSKFFSTLSQGANLEAKAA